MKKIRLFIAAIGILVAIAAFSIGASLPTHAAGVGGFIACRTIIAGYIVNGHVVPYHGPQCTSRSIKIIPLGLHRGFQR